MGQVHGDVVNVHEAKARLSALLDAVEAGATIVLARRNRPVARLVPLEGASRRPGRERPAGLARGAVTLTDAFFEPMKEEELALWEGAPLLARAAEPAARGAEEPGGSGEAG